MRSQMRFPRFARVWSTGWALVALFALTLFAPLSNAFAAESTCSVAPNGAAYTTIQSAVNDSTCAIINVAAGTYFENVVITHNVTINGATNGGTIVDGNHKGAVFDNTRQASATLANLTIQHGSGYNNTEGDHLGGGIISLSITTVINTTIRDNSASHGGGIFSNGGILTLVNSTIAGNTAHIGGAISTGVKMNVINSTIVGNDITNLGTMTLVNTLVAHSDAKCYFGGTIGGHNNVIETIDNACGLANGVNGNIIGQDAKLGALQNNGGPTATIALLPDSPAINAGDDTVCSAAPVSGVDQRGVARPNGAHCDIGAYEATATDAPVVKVSFPTPNGQNGWFTSSPVVGSVTATSLSRITGVNCSGAAFSNLSLQSPFVAQGTLTVTADGTYNVSCNAGDADGHYGVGAGSQANVTVKIDTTAPDTTITAQPSNLSENGLATFAFTGVDTGSGVNSVACALDGSAFATCTSPQTYNGLSLGSHTFQVRATDRAGNIDSTPASATWQVTDSTAPVTTFQKTPDAPNANGWYTSAVSVKISARDDLSGIAETRCVLDPATVPATFANLPSGCAFGGAGATISTEGVHLLYTASRDQANNTEQMRRITIKLDKTAPTATASVNQSAPSASATVTITASDAVSGIDTTNYSINGGATQVYTAPIVLNAAGTYQISFTSSDKAGNISTAQSQTVTIAAPTINHSPSVQVIDAPRSVVENVLESNQYIRAFTERQNYTLPADLTVDAQGAPGTVIRTGTKVNVYYIHADKVGNTNSTALKLAGSVMFDTTILAVVTNGTVLKNTHATLGNTQYASTATAYSASVDQGIDYGDKVTVTSQQNRVDVAFDLWSMSDDVRVITLAP